MGRGLQRPATDGAPAVDVPALVRTPSEKCYYSILMQVPLGNGKMV